MTDAELNDPMRDFIVNMEDSLMALLCSYTSDISKLRPDRNCSITLHVSAEVYANICLWAGTAIDRLTMKDDRGYITPCGFGLTIVNNGK